ncbi:MAG: NADH-quinone oxidoreductase subunit J [Acidobacteria bacterium]|nr:NADH-quinone oxidoreductase subunit J [Acidobacteriota bacterium]MBI3264430.1 NADH-quinone oxidoreductase subunit J [Acidobacteriota bacterium]
MPPELILFYVFGAAAVVASVFVIGQRNPMYSVLLLIASFAALSGLYVLLDAPFVAVIQIIIYAGAVMVLFLFVVMLLNAPREEAAAVRVFGSPTTRRMGALLALTLLVELVWALSRAGQREVWVSGPPDRLPSAVGSVRAIGLALFRDYAFAFEVTSVLILVAMLGAVVLAKREL